MVLHLQSGNKFNAPFNLHSLMNLTTVEKSLNNSQNLRLQSSFSGTLWNLKSSRKTNFSRISGTIFVYSSQKIKFIFFKWVYTFPYSNHSTAVQKKYCSLILHFIKNKKIPLYLKHHLPVNRTINLILFQIISEYLDKIKGIYFAKFTS